MKKAQLEKIKKIARKAAAEVFDVLIAEAKAANKALKSKSVNH